MAECSKNLEVKVVDGVVNGESLRSHDRATEIIALGKSLSNLRWIHRMIYNK